MQTFKKLAFFALIAASLSLLLVQCSVENLLPAVIGKKIWLIDGESNLRQEFLRRIPVGSSIAEAKSILQLNGFKCGYQKGYGFIDSAETNLTSKEADYLSCTLELPQLVCTRTYTSFVRYKNETVTNIDSDIGGWCL